MRAHIETLRNSFSLKIFLMGVGGVVALYIALFAYALIAQSSTLEALERNLAHYTVLLENVHNADAPDIAPDSLAHQEPLQDAGHHDEHINAPEKEQPPTEDHAAPHQPPADQDDNLSLAEMLHGDKTSRGKGLRDAPLPKLSEETPQGIVPIKVIGLPSVFEAYKKPFILNKNKHAVSIVIADYGLSETLSNTILKEMPSAVSLILSPYAAHVQKWQKKARRDGHEIWIDLPLQTLDFPRSDPGPKGLLTDASLAYNEERLEWALSRTSGYAGVSSFTDSALQKSSPMFTRFFNQIFGRGLGLLELNKDTAEQAFVAGLARAKNAPYAASTMTLKSFAPDSSAIKAAEAHITAHQNTIIVVKPTAGNLETLKNWLMRIENSGVVIAPVSALAALSVE